LGVIAFNRKQFDQAEKRWLAAAGDAPAAWFGLAKLNVLQGKYDDAAKWAQKVLDQEPNDATMSAVLAAAKAKALPPELKAQLAPAAETESGADAQKGWALMNAGQLNQAKAAFEGALAKNDKDFSARNGLAFCLLNLGKPADAKPHFERLLKDQPDAPGPMNGLARCLVAEGKTDEAIALWESVAKKTPGVSAATAGLAWAYFERKDYAKATPYLEQLLKAQPDDQRVKDALKVARQ
jgi:tetratricopeptide (TPR) repeat protein